MRGRSEKTWEKVHIALWGGSALLAFTSRRSFDEWSAAPTRSLGSASRAIDLEMVVGISSAGPAALTLHMHDGDTLEIRFPSENDRKSWLSRLAGPIAASNRRVHRLYELSAGRRIAAADTLLGDVSGVRGHNLGAGVKSLYQNLIHFKSSDPSTRRFHSTEDLISGHSLRKKWLLQVSKGELADYDRVVNVDGTLVVGETGTIDIHGYALMKFPARTWLSRSVFRKVYCALWNRSELLVFSGKTEYFKWTDDPRMDRSAAWHRLALGFMDAVVPDGVRAGSEDARAMLIRYNDGREIRMAIPSKNDPTGKTFARWFSYLNGSGAGEAEVLPEPAIVMTPAAQTDMIASGSVGTNGSDLLKLGALEQRTFNMDMHPRIPYDEYLKLVVQFDAEITATGRGNIDNGPLSSLAIWNDSLIVSFIDDEFNVHTCLKRAFMKPLWCIDLENVIGVREVKHGSHKIRSLELQLYSGDVARLDMLINEENEGKFKFLSWLMRLRGIVTSNNKRIHSFLDANGLTDDQLTCNCSDIQSTSLSATTLALIARLHEMKQGIASARLKAMPTAPFTKEELKRFVNLSDLHVFLDKIVPISSDESPSLESYDLAIRSALHI